MALSLQEARNMVEAIETNDVYDPNDWELDFVDSIHSWLYKGFGLTEKQEACLQRIYNKLLMAGYTEEEKPQQKPDERNPYEVLGVDEDMSLDDIQKKYRTLVMQCHPDRAGGLHPEIIAFASEKMKRINAAFDCIKKERGE